MDVQALSESKNKFVSDTFKIIASRKNTVLGDEVPLYRLTESDLREIQALAEGQVLASHIDAGIRTESVTQMEADLKLTLGDELYNRATGIGTFHDPSTFTHTTIPVMLGAGEESALYASGGLPALIIDKKARGMVTNGLSFKTFDDKIWSDDDIQALEESAFSTGLNDVLSDAITDSFIYGGSVCFPFFNTDTPATMLRPLERYPLQKGCVSRWVSVDRWNLTTVPSYQVLHSDYINPKTMFVPQDALEVSCSRMAILRPKPMPYWAALYNLGWSPSDFAGWLRSYYAYKITMQSIPVMAQQMSLLLYRMPLDALNATVGTKEVEKLMDINKRAMADWSAVNPEAVNMIGEVEVVNRTYSGLDHFLGAMKSDLASQCEIPEPVLWHTQNKGFSDTTGESLLKQSENMQMRQKYIERSLKGIRDILICHTFGQDSSQYKNKDRLYPTLSKPIIATEKDMAEVGARFAASVASFVSADVPPDVAIDLSLPFFPTVKITDEMLSAVKKAYEDKQKREEKMAQQKMQASQNSSSGSGKPNQGPKTQTPGVGHFSKPAK